MQTVVINGFIWRTFIRSQAKQKPSFTQYFFLTIFFNQNKSIMGIKVYDSLYTISSTFMQFPYTLIWSWTLSYSPKLNLNPHSRNTLYNQKRWLRKGITGMKVWVKQFFTLLYDLKLSQTILNTLIRSWTLIRSQAKDISFFNR